MSDKKRDSKGRVLRSGEAQRKDGRYMYRYIGVNGEKQCVYSWKLVDTDKAPAGKKCEESLREMEKRIQRDKEDGINSHKAKRTSLNSFYDAYIETKYELKQSTRTNYKYMYAKYIREEIGGKSIGSFKYSDIKKFYIHLIKELGFKPNSMEIIHTILHPVFQTAVRDGYIRINPTDGVMADIKKSHDWEKPKRHALTIPQQERLVAFVSASPVYRHWMPIITVMLGTGARIGEICGLRWTDLDYRQNIISINHNLIYRVQENGKMEMHITTPKTKAGTRIIPMFTEVKKTFLLEYERQRREEGLCRAEVDGFTDFIFQTRHGEPIHPHIINRALERIIRDANKDETARSEKEGREPILLPHFSCHHLRHTFCTRLCENETNLKVIQEIMGHKNIETTMDVYNEATKEKKMEAFANLEGKLVIS